MSEMKTIMRWIVPVSVLSAFLGFLAVSRNGNNVCLTFEDYYTNRDLNNNCYYNPEFLLEVPEIVRRKGYPLEEYPVTTEDGYTLTVFRIPHGKESKGKKKRKPIFLQHGMTLNSGIYVNIGNKSLAYILADAGYDVWLGNFRGSMYSKNHSKLSVNDEEFWNYTFHENGVYDIPSQLNIVYNITQQKVIFIGYSLGSTAVYIYSSLFPEAAKDRIDIIINFAPSIYTEEVGKLFTLVGYMWWLLETPAQLIFKGKIYVRQPIPFDAVKMLCLPFPFQMRMCQLLEMTALGFNFAQNDPETLPITILHNTDTASIKSITHFIQIGFSKRFQYFDYGVARNLKLYNTTNPPLYNLSKVQVPTYTFAGKNDLAVSQKSLDRLYEELPRETLRYGVYHVEDINFSHLNFITAKDIVPLVYEHLLKFLENFLQF
ncbi:hypothetical protein FQA39_LY14477 [Lamprigera yunnana]|nr:hypothetical protein FQA39_LY14477 [Lamprigera yunnana]